MTDSRQEIAVTNRSPKQIQGDNDEFNRSPDSPFRRQEGFLHRRSRDPRAFGHTTRHPKRRIRFDRRSFRLRQVDACCRFLACSIRRATANTCSTNTRWKIFRLSERARIRNREVGFIFQSFNLIGDLTVYENVELPLTYRGMSSGERKKRVTDALESVGMGHRAKHLPSQLSGGQQQRVAVARAVGGQPSILLADEPTGNLDSTNGEAVMELLRDLHRGGATICMVTHDARYAQHADRIVHLFDGLIVEEEAGANRREVEDAKRELKESGLGAIG